jgi:hypothetical protein
MKFVNESLEDILKPKELDMGQKIAWALKSANTKQALRVFREATAQGIKIPAKDLLELGMRTKNLVIFREAVDRLTTNPHRKLDLAAKFGFLPFFREIIDKGGRVSFNLLKKLTNDYEYQHSEEILDYVKNNIDVVAKEEDRQKIHYALGASDQEYRSYPKGYKQYRVLKYINEHPVTRRLDLIKFIYEMGYGPGSFNEIRSSSYWSNGFNQIIGQYYDVNDDGIFVLNREGVSKLRELESKFAGQNIDSYV